MRRVTDGSGLPAGGQSSDPVPRLAGLTLLVVLVLFGGASRNDMIFQPITQIACIGVGAVALMLPPNASATRVRPLVWLVVALCVVVAAQLVPLPPEIWRNLPGRSLEAEISDGVGLSSIWRPLSIAPDLTLSALLAMVVPVAVVVAFTRLPASATRSVMWAAAAAGVLNVAIVLWQAATGATLPFYPGPDGSSAGLFDNRNHAAIFLATLPPVIAFLTLQSRGRADRPEQLWAGAAVALTLIAVGVVLTGSRIGLVVLFPTLVGTTLMVVTTRAGKGRDPIRTPPIAGRSAAAIGAVLISIVLAATVSQRTDTSLTRMAGTGFGSENRLDLWRPLLELAGRYFPTGSGFGTFDRAYRMVEAPDALRLFYLNHAHNDLIEVVIEAGAAAIALLATAAVMSIRRAIPVWRIGGGFRADRDLARVGSIVAVGLLLGSLSDYPLRTPALAGWMTFALCLLTAGPGSVTSCPGAGGEPRETANGVDGP